MSLSRFLRDYLFIPLGGSRGGQWATCRNLMLTMLLGGLWHGASWTFLLWGGLHGGLLVAYRFWSVLPPAPLAGRADRAGTPPVAWRRHGDDLPRGLPVLVLFPAECAG